MRNDISFSKLQVNVPLQAILCTLHLNRLYAVCSLYLPPGVPVERDDINNLVLDLPSPFILLGYFNGRRPMWGDCTTNSRGALLASFIENEELYVLNSGEMTSFHVQTRTYTTIDISLCSSDALLDFNWRVLPDLYGSDHFPILLETAGAEPRSCIPRSRLDRTDWKLFMDLCSNVRPNEDFNSSEEAATYFTDMIHSAALMPVPRTSGKFPRRPVP